MSTKPLGPIVAIVAAATLVAACTSTRFGSLNTQPAPLSPAPAGTVTSGQLPPPSAPQAAGQGNFPSAPGGAQTAGTLPADGTNPTFGTDGTQTGLDAGAAVAATGPVSRDTMVGAWRVSTQGVSCQVFMALTQSVSGGPRAAARGCPGEVANVRSWDVSGNQVVLSDSGGNRVATLFQSGEGRFDGQTNGGQSLSLAR